MPLLLLAACGPMTVEQAERQCLERARLAEQPRGTVSIGVNSDGDASGNVGVTISSDYLLGRDPAAVFETCVQSLSGQAPRRSLASMPGWRG